MNRLCILSFILLFIFFACNSEQKPQDAPTEKVSQNNYSNEKFGWKVTLPKAWKKTSEVEKYLLKKSGEKAIEIEFNENSTDTWTELLNIYLVGKDINQLSASYSQYDPQIHGNSYEKSRETRFNGVKRIIESKGVEVEVVRTTTTIDQLEFKTFNMLTTKEGQHQFYQILMEKKFDNNDILLISIFATEREKLESFKNSVLESTFNRRK